MLSEMASTMIAAFNQTEQGRLQGGKGTGLGLALVRQIVKLSGGRLGVQSKVGEGSTFWVELRKYLSQSSYAHTRAAHLDCIIALGVGIKAIPALDTPTDIDEDEDPRAAVYAGAKEHVPKVGLLGLDGYVDVRSSFQFNQSYSSSALHSIMDQGMPPTLSSSSAIHPTY